MLQFQLYNLVIPQVCTLGCAHYNQHMDFFFRELVPEKSSPVQLPDFSVYCLPGYSASLRLPIAFIFTTSKSFQMRIQE